MLPIMGDAGFISSAIVHFHKAELGLQPAASGVPWASTDRTS